MEIVHIHQDWVEKIQKILSKVVEEGTFNESWNGRTVRINLLDGPVYEPNWCYLGDGLYQINDDVASMLVHILDLHSEYGLPDHHWESESGTVICWWDGVKKHRSLQKYIDYMLPYRVHVPEAHEEEDHNDGD